MSQRPVSFIYAVRTVSGQEMNVALIMRARAEGQKLPIRSIVVIENIRGVVFVETTYPYYVDRLIYGIKHVRGRVPGKVNITELEHLLIPKPVIEELSIGDEVEVISGPFRGVRGRVTHIDKASGTIRIELLDASYPLPLTLKADFVKPVRKAKT